MTIPPPTLEPIIEPQWKYYSSSPVFSNFGFDDNAALDSGWYQLNSYSGNWTSLFSDNPDTSWDNNNWIVPAFNTLPKGPHIIYFKASDDMGNVEGENGEWSWCFYKESPPAVSGGNDLFIDSGQLLGNSNSDDVALGDLDGDGDLDAFVTNYNDPSNQANRVWLNDGNGNFSDSGQSIGASSSYGGIGLGDLDGDGDLDAFVANNNDPSKIWLNDGDGTFIDSGQTLNTAGSLSVELGDIDSDGDLDVLIGNSNGNPKFWLNDGNGNFSDSGQSLGYGTSFAVGFSDIDSDGDLDAVVISYHEVSKIYFNDGNGNYSDSGQSLDNPQGHDVGFGDLDGDGDNDMFFANHNRPDQIWLNDSTGNFSLGQSLVSSYSQSVSLGDLDGDGDLDAFVAQYHQPNKVWINNGAGIFSESGQPFGGGSQRGVALGDLDGDGDLDAFVIRDSQISSPKYSSVFLNWEDTTNPSTALINTPSDGTYYQISTMPTTFSGNAADAAIAVGLSENSTKFHIKRQSDNKYWDGSSWVDTVFWLSSAHEATGDNSSIGWTNSSILPNWADDIYTAQAKATDFAGNSFIGTTITFAFDTTLPTMETIVESEGQYHRTAPVLSNFGFDDNLALDDGWYQLDSYLGNWTVLFEDVSVTSWDSDNWTMLGFGSLVKGSHTIYFKVSDNSGNVEGESGEWSWQFFKQLPPRPSNGGGGGGTRPDPATTTINVVSQTTGEGRFTNEVKLSSKDGMVTLVIPKNTLGKTKKGSPLDLIRVKGMSNPPAPPPESNIIGLAYDFGPDGATFDPPIDIEVSYDSDSLPEGVNPEDLTIAWWDEANNEWVAIEGCTVDIENSTVIAPVNHFTLFTILTIPPSIELESVQPPTQHPGFEPSPTMIEKTPPVFSVSDLTITPTKAEPYEMITVTTVVTNSGGSKGNHIVILKINGVEEDEQILTLEPGMSEKVAFNINEATEGTYFVDINGIGGRLEVAYPQSSDITPIIEEEPVPVWSIILGTIIICFMITVISIPFIRDRRMKN
ncbi:FG-GAP-like repeat-containing protein [Chloroflexota bacterium]